MDVRVRGQEQGPGGPNRSNRRTVIAALLVFLLGVLGTVAYFGSRTNDRPELARIPPAAAPPPEEPEPEVKDRLWRAASPEDMAFGDFAPAMGLGGELDPMPDPNLEAFGAAIMEQPALAEIVREFRRDDARGKRPLARLFLEKLERQPEFKTVTAQYSGQPAFAKALKKVLKGPKGAEVAAVMESVVAEPAPEDVEKGKKKLKALKRKKRSNTSDFTNLLSGLAAEVFDAVPSSFTVKVVSGTIPLNLPGEDPMAVKQNMDAMEHAVTERTKRFLEVYPWLRPLGLANLHRLEQEAPKYGLYGACFSLLLHQRCWNACKSDPEGKCQADAQTWNAWNACHDWKGTGEQADKVCISRCLYQKPCVVPPPIYAHYCHCRPGCCGKGGCGCCASPYHPHGFCRPAWEGQNLTDAPDPYPASLFYPACSSHGVGPNHCDCCYDQNGRFAYDVLDPHGKFRRPLRSLDGSACRGSCEPCGPRGCIDRSQQ